MQLHLPNRQSYLSVMPWLMQGERVRITTIENDESGDISSATIVNSVLKFVAKARHHIIQLNLLASNTKQKVDLLALTG